MQWVNRKIIHVNLPGSLFFRECLIMDRCYLGVRDRRCSSIHFTYACIISLIKIASCSNEISEILNVALVSPIHKITFSEEFNSSLTIKSSLSPYGYTGCLKKSKSNGVAHRLSKVFLIAFSWVVTVSAVPSDFFAPTRAFKPLADCMPGSSFSSRSFSLK